MVGSVVVVRAVVVVLAVVSGSSQADYYSHNYDYIVIVMLSGEAETK